MNTWAHLALVSGGMVLMVVALGRALRFGSGIQRPRLRRLWRLLTALTGLFLAGYGAALMLVAAGRFETLATLTTWIFFAGALFVLLTVHLAIKLNVDLLASNARMARTQRELEVKNAELERFVYTVSHDLKSPIVTIRGFLGLLAKDVGRGDEARVRHDVERISAAADKMQRLLDELLELSRIGRLLNPLEDVPLTEAAREAARRISATLGERGVELEIAAEMPRVRGDRVRLVEVFQNLFENAARFMGDEAAPRIEAGTRRRNGEPIVFVRDNGIGVAPEYHERIFKLFERLDAATDGTGVGLALVKRIVEIHGGRIWVESRGPGSGSEFCFTLPPEGPAAAALSDAADGGSATLPPP